MTRALETPDEERVPTAATVRTHGRCSYASRRRSPARVRYRARRDGKIGTLSGASAWRLRLRRNGRYARVEPSGTRWRAGTAREGTRPSACCPTRWRAACRRPRRSRAGGDEVEGSVTVEAAAAELRPDITLPSAVRWVRRGSVRAALLAMVTMPARGARRRSAAWVRRSVCAWCSPSSAGASRRGSALPPPLGFGPRTVASAP